MFTRKSCTLHFDGTCSINYFVFHLKMEKMMLQLIRESRRWRKLKMTRWYYKMGMLSHSENSTVNQTLQTLKIEFSIIDKSSYTLLDGKKIQKSGYGVTWLEYHEFITIALDWLVYCSDPGMLCKIRHVISIFIAGQSTHQLLMYVEFEQNADCISFLLFR